MLELMPNDLTAVQSVTEGTVRWCPGDAYSQALGNKLEYAGRVRQAGPGIRPVRGSTRTYYTPSQPRSQNTSDSHMAERIRELELERDQQRAKIEELERKKSENAARFQENEARFWRLEALFLHGTSSSSFPKVAHPGGHPEGGTAVIYVVFVFHSANMNIFRLDQFDDNA